MSNDPWAASSAPAYATPQATSPAGDSGSNFAGSFANEACSSLFSGQGESLPSLFNKFHQPGTTIKGRIISPPKDVQATSFPQRQGDPRLPLYWCTDSNGKRRPGTDAVDPRTGKENDKVMNTVIELQTDQRLTDAERNDPQMERAQYDDDGRRVWQVSGPKKPRPGHQLGQPANSMRAMLDAIAAAVQNGIRMTSEKDMVGKYVTVTRVQREQPGVSTSPWTWTAVITND